MDEARQQLADSADDPNLVMYNAHLTGAEDGAEVIRRIRRLSERRLPALLLSDDSTSSTLEMSEAIERCRLLRKPVEADEFLRVVQQLIAENEVTLKGRPETRART